jgi:dihydroorotase
MQIQLIQPDDWHCHLRDDDYLGRTVPDIARQFKRAIIMPNLKPAITTIDQARHYRERIAQHVPQHTEFQPLMTLYLTENMPPDIFLDAKKSGVITAALPPSKKFFHY